MREQQIYNLEIAYELLDYLLENPELRFIQALWALGIVNGADKFHEPSKKTLERVNLRKNIEKERRQNAEPPKTSEKGEEAAKEELGAVARVSKIKKGCPRKARKPRYNF